MDLATGNRLTFKDIEDIKNKRSISEQIVKLIIAIQKMQMVLQFYLYY